MGNHEEKMSEVQKANKKLIEACKGMAYPFFNENEKFWNQNNTPLKKTLWRGKESEKSLQFACKKKNGEENDHYATTPDEVAKILKSTFGVDFVDAYKDVFSQAVSGAGNEYKRITTLHSSALAALLCFYKVKDNRLKINIQGTDINFDHVKFEHENQVTYAYKKDSPATPLSKTKDDRPSSIDVALSNQQGKVLFLESKFSEYLTNGLVSGISTKYEQFFKDLGFKTEKIESSVRFNEDIFLQKSNDGEYTLRQYPRTINYLGGFKQMICHFMGACEYAKNHPQQDVYLGTILFEFPQGIDKGSSKKYSNLYFELVVELRKLNKTCTNLHLLSEPLTYQEVFKNQPNYQLPDKVKQFYKL